MSLAARLYRALGRVLPCDVTVVLRLDVSRLRRPLGPPSDTPSPTVALLDAADVRARAAAGVAGFADALPRDASVTTLRCAAALDGERAIAHVWFATDDVPAALNSGGERFAGIGLRLPAGTLYLFKAHVDPAWRGRALGAMLVGEAVRRLADDGVRHVVTTTDFTNEAFRRSAASLGFERCDWAAEIVLGSAHRFRLPRPLALGDAARVEFVAGRRRVASNDAD